MWVLPNLPNSDPIVVIGQSLRVLIFWGGVTEPACELFKAIVVPLGGLYAWGVVLALGTLYTVVTIRNHDNKNTGCSTLVAVVVVTMAETE